MYISKSNRVGDTVSNYNLSKLLSTRYNKYIYELLNKHQQIECALSFVENFEFLVSDSDSGTIFTMCICIYLYTYVYNSFSKSLVIRKEAFSSESTSQISCGVPVRKNFSWFSVGGGSHSRCICRPQSLHAFKWNSPDCRIGNSISSYNFSTTKRKRPS